MLDVRRLRLLSELSRRGTIAAVARVVGYTPSAVSQSLARLEREVGVALLERDGRRVRLTPAAVALVARAERVFDELDAAEADLAAEHQEVRGSATIGAFPSAAAGLVAPAVAQLAERHPDLTCSIREHEPEDGIPLLRSGELDVLVSESYDGMSQARIGGLDSQLLVTEPLLLLAPASARPGGGPVALRKLEDEPWIAGIAGTQFAAALERACAAAGFHPRIVHRADDATLLHRLVEAGLGIALLPRLAYVPTDGIAVRRVTPAPPRRQIHALVRRRAARRPALAAIVDALHRASRAVQTARPAAT